MDTKVYQFIYRGRSKVYQFVYRYGTLLYQFIYRMKSKSGTFCPVLRFWVHMCPFLKPYYYIIYYWYTNWYRSVRTIEIKGVMRCIK